MYGVVFIIFGVQSLHIVMPLGVKSLKSNITVNSDGQFGLIKVHQSWSMLINVNQY